MKVFITVCILALISRSNAIRLKTNPEVEVNGDSGITRIEGVMTDFQSAGAKQIEGGLYSQVFDAADNMGSDPPPVGHDADHDGEKEKKSRKIVWQIILNSLFVLYLIAFYLVFKKKEKEDE